MARRVIVQHHPHVVVVLVRIHKWECRGAFPLARLCRRSEGRLNSKLRRTRRLLLQADEALSLSTFYNTVHCVFKETREFCGGYRLLVDKVLVHLLEERLYDLACLKLRKRVLLQLSPGEVLLLSRGPRHLLRKCKALLVKILIYSTPCLSYASVVSPEVLAVLVGYLWNWRLPPCGCLGSAQHAGSLYDTRV